MTDHREPTTATNSVADKPSLRRLAIASLLLPPALLTLGMRHAENVTYLLLLLQDRWLLLTAIGLAAITLIPVRLGPPALLSSFPRVAFLAAVVALAGYVGHYFLLDGYDLSRDEQMASFDALIYGAGHLAWPLPPGWQAAPGPLNMVFMLPVDHPVAWVSAYLPGNALLRALCGRLADPALAGPFYSGLGVLLLWGCARRIWPRDDVADRETATVAVVLLATSGQLVMTGMTAYAMPAHLCCNLAWLWLFLRDRRACDLAAVAVGFVATGLHQPLFHPLFVAPFLVLLIRERRWSRLALFCGFTLAETAFWFAWPLLTHALVAGPQSLPGTHGIDYGSRLAAALAGNRDNIAIMAANLLRFVTWQHLLLLPLLLASLGTARHDRMAAALLASFLLPIVVMGIIIPFQGQGFGYRYLHGSLGSAALLGGYGWRRCRHWQAWLRPLFVRASLATLLIMLPFQAWLGHRLYAVYAGLDRRISTSGADYFMIGEGDAPLALDLAFNRPDLGNRPIRLVAGEIGDPDALAARICHPGTSIALPGDAFFGPIADTLGTPRSHQAGARFVSEARTFRQAGCRVIAA